MAKPINMVKQFAIPLTVAVTAALVLGAWHYLDSWSKDRLFAGNSGLYYEVSAIVDTSIITLAVTVIVAIILHRSSTRRSMSAAADRIRQLEADVAQRNAVVATQNSQIAEFEELRERVLAERFVAHKNSGDALG